MEYVNKITGEVYQVEEIGLGNICDGDLDFVFKSEFKQLVEKLAHGDKGTIAISIKVQKGAEGNGDVSLAVETQLGVKCPKLRINDMNTLKVAENCRVVKRVDDGMFNAING